ncbi:MAG TPA: haloalkane dehalogenase [Steroidobacteraceae bacterium]|nr:haloalkane dehalogenase [Steroidobacteraceae bacterium]
MVRAFRRAGIDDGNTTAGVMKYLRTPEARFENLPGYAFQPNYLSVDDSEGGVLRLHYVDDGRRDAPIVLMLHGEPSWSYLYRKMIPIFTAAGYRAIAPDLIGFGRSDKPSQRSDYTFARHVQWIYAAVARLQLQDITLVCQDWGGLIGLRLVAEHPEWFARVVAANTMLPTGDHPPGDAFLKWQSYSQNVPALAVGGIIQRSTTTPLTESVVAAYDAPFPDESYKEGARQFPMLVPISPDDPAAPANRKAWEVLRQFRKPFLTAFSDKDPITAGGDSVLQKLIPGCRGQPHTTITNAGHFLQEDQGERLAQVVVDFMRRTTAA